MPNDQSKNEISYLPRSWGPSRYSREKPVREAAEVEGPETFQEDATVEQAPPESVKPEPMSHQADKPRTSQKQERHSDFQRRSRRSPKSPSTPAPRQPECVDILEHEDTLDSAMAPLDDSTEDAPNGSDLSERIGVRVCGIRFSYASKIYHFESGAMALDYGEWVVVKTEKGLGLGQVALPPFEKQIHVSQLEGLRKIIRKGGKVDLYQKERCREREQEARRYCLDKIEELDLPMKLVTVECFFDGSKYVFYFTSEGRVDFRELVKQLVARFPVRIEMRQIGVRHEAKMTGGLAGCGQELCCSRFLTDFRPVSVKMAKNQNLSLNPTKISGVCGRLMCCLGYEHDTYEEFSRGLPKVGRMVKTNCGDGLVLKHNPLEETILLKIDDETQIEVKRQDIISEFEAVVAKSEDQPPNPKTSKKAAQKQTRDKNLSGDTEDQN